MSSRSFGHVGLGSTRIGAPSAPLATDTMKLYVGKRLNDQTLVTMNGKPLDPRFDLWVHTLEGFEWGHCGSGAAQLALALLADHLDDKRQAVALHQAFEHAVVINLPEQGWVLSTSEVQEVLDLLKPRTGHSSIGLKEVV